MTRKEIGKIEVIEFAENDGRIGFWFTLSGKGWGVGDFWGGWGIARSEHADRLTRLGDAVMRVNKLFDDAKVESLSALKGKPIEAIFQDGSLYAWRILTEAIL